MAKETPLKSIQRKSFLTTHLKKTVVRPVRGRRIRPFQVRSMRYEGVLQWKK